MLKKPVPPQPLEDNTDIMDFMSVPESPQEDYQDEINELDTSVKVENPLDTSINQSI